MADLLILPFAGLPLQDEGYPAPIEPPSLPNLAALLARLLPAARDDADAYRLSPPHERELARALGLAGADGCLPWAAHAAAADGIDTGELAWGLLSPVNWQVGRESLTMGDPAALGLDPALARAYFDVLQPLLADTGWPLLWGAPTRWFVTHESLAALPTASLDRVIGRNPDVWLPDSPVAKPFKRLASEVQMLLYTHPLNEAREARGEPPLNSVWLSGCGRHQPPRRDADVTVDDRLRAPALAGDWPTWCAAWQSLDAGPLAALRSAAERGEPVALTLCGERSAAGFATRTTPAPLWQRVRTRLAPPRVDTGALLAGL